MPAQVSVPVCFEILREASADFIKKAPEDPVTRNPLQKNSRMVQQVQNLLADLEWLLLRQRMAGHRLRPGLGQSRPQLRLSMQVKPHLHPAEMLVPLRLLLAAILQATPVAMVATGAGVVQLAAPRVVGREEVVCFGEQRYSLGKNTGVMLRSLRLI